MSIQALREHRNEVSRAMNHLLAEKGAQVWAKEDQDKFDGMADELTRLDGQIAAHQRMLDERAEKHFTDAGRQDPNAPANEGRRGLELFLRKSQREMTADEIAIVRNTMSTTTGSQGGYAVQTTVASEFIDMLKDFGGVRRVAGRIATANGADLSYPSTDGRAEVGEIVTQNSSAAAADASFGTVPLNTVKFGSKVIAVPIELLQDATIDIVSLVNKRLRDRIGRVQNAKFSVGTGTGEPYGITAAAPVGVTGAAGSTTTITYDSLVGMVEAVDFAYQSEGGLSWLTGQTMRGTIRKLKDSTNRPIFLPGYGSIDQDLGDYLLGYALQINNDMPAPGANAISMSFGQHRKYLVRDAMEVTLFRFEDSAYMSKGQVGFLAWARAGGNLIDTAAVVTYKHSAT